MIFKSFHFILLLFALNPYSSVVGTVGVALKELSDFQAKRQGY